MFVAAGALCLAGACDTELADESWGDEWTTEEAVIARAASAAEGGFVLVADGTVSSMASTDKFLEVWVSEEAVEAYQQVHPEDYGTGVSMPADTMVIRTLRDASGVVQKHTVLWFPDEANSVEDLYFLVADPDWNVITNEDVRQAGPLESCQGCHAARAEDGFVFGVPFPR